MGKCVSSRPLCRIQTASTSEKQRDWVCITCMEIICQMTRRLDSTKIKDQESVSWIHFFRSFVYSFDWYVFVHFIRFFQMRPVFWCVYLLFMWMFKRVWRWSYCLKHEVLLFTRLLSLSFWVFLLLGLGLLGSSYSFSHISFFLTLSVSFALSMPFYISIFFFHFHWYVCININVIVVIHVDVIVSCTKRFLVCLFDSPFLYIHFFPFPFVPICFV